MDSYITRQIEKRLLRLADHFPVIVVTGARQVGKTTLLRHLFSEADHVTFDPTVDVENARADPDLFLDNHREPLVLDEIQYAPEVVSAIKRRVDDDRKPGRFILTGSQQWSVLRNISESLAGRAVILEMGGFSIPETCGCMDHSPPWIESWLSDPDGFVSQPRSCAVLPYSLYEFLYRGCLPESTALPIDVLQHHLRSYQRTYIERDVRLLASLSDEQLFGRFFQLASTLTAQEINMSQFGREIGIAPKTARKWLSILRGTFQWHEVPPYHGNAIKRISGKRKGYIADTGIACMAQSVSSPAALGGHPMLGPLFETAVVNEIVKQTQCMSTPPNMYHWRSHSGAEVDLLLEYDGSFFPIEVKSKTYPKNNDTRGISAFRKSYPQLSIHKGLVLCCTKKSFPLNSMDVAMPWNVITR